MESLDLNENSRSVLPQSLKKIRTRIFQSWPEFESLEVSKSASGGDPVPPEALVSGGSKSASVGRVFATGSGHCSSNPFGG
jgi:hypothetical protein